MDSTSMLPPGYTRDEMEIWNLSWQALNWALSANTGDPTSKLVLILLANHASQKDASCYPSQQRLAEQGQMSERTVRKALAELEAKGLIKRESRRHGNRRTSDLIHLSLPAGFAGSSALQPEESASSTGEICRGIIRDEPTDLHLANVQQVPWPSFEEQAAQAGRLAARFRAPGGLTDDIAQAE